MLMSVRRDCLTLNMKAVRSGATHGATKATFHKTNLPYPNVPYGKTVPFSRGTIQLRCHSAGIPFSLVPFSHGAIQPRYHLASVPFSRGAIQPQCRSAAVTFSHAADQAPNVIQSRCLRQAAQCSLQWTSHL